MGRELHNHCLLSMNQWITHWAVKSQSLQFKVDKIRKHTPQKEQNYILLRQTTTVESYKSDCASLLPLVTQGIIESFLVSFFPGFKECFRPVYITVSEYLFQSHLSVPLQLINMGILLLFGRVTNIIFSIKMHYYGSCCSTEEKKEGLICGGFFQITTVVYLFPC